MIGLKRNEVQLLPHDPAWEQLARETLSTLERILGGAVRDAQHVGSTAIPHICAKPVIDIAVGMGEPDDILPFIPQLERNGFIHRPMNDNEWQRFFSCGDFAADIRTHHIHVVSYGGAEWCNYLNFRDYLTRFPDEARRYEAVKLRLAARYPHCRAAYTESKSEIILHMLRKALVWSWLGKRAHIIIDRPVGHIRHGAGYALEYPINYGYIPGVTGGDGEELDVYLMGVSEPVGEYDCRIIGVVYRRNDDEDKLIAAPDGMSFTRAEMEDAVRFQEQFYDSYIRTGDGA